MAENEIKGHPAWQEILDVLPDSLHPIIKPKLQEWDKGVQDKIQSLHSEYEGLKKYKKLADAEVDPDFLVTAYNLAVNLENNPGEVLEQANKAFNLGWASPQEVEVLKSSGSSDDEDDFEDFGDGDIPITKHPEFLSVKQALEALQNKEKEREQESREEQEIREHEAFLDELLSGDNANVNRDFVTALMSQGWNDEDAIAEWYRATNTQPGSTSEDTTNSGENTGERQPIPSGNDGEGQDNNPVVMGGSAGGSGMPQQTVNYGSMGDAALNDVVVQMLQQAAADNQG